MRLPRAAAKRNLNGTLGILSVVGIAAVAALLIFALGNSPRAHAQSAKTIATPMPSFEVAVIKPNHSGDGGSHIRMPDAGRFVATNVTAKGLITFAYSMRDFQVSGGPAWIASDRFDVVAKIDDSLAQKNQKLLPAQQQDQVRLLVRSLLADRFQLSISHETKQLPVYALVVARGGSKLKEVPPPDPRSSVASPPHPSAPGAALAQLPPGRFGMDIDDSGAVLTASAIPISNLVNLLSQALARPLVDRTGLKGTYDIKLKWTPDTGPGGGQLQVAPDSAAENDAASTSIFTALEEQLGLRLESTKGPVDTIVIDHIEQPSEN